MEGSQSTAIGKIEIVECPRCGRKHSPAIYRDMNKKLTKVSPLTCKCGANLQ